MNGNYKNDPAGRYYDCPICKRQFWVSYPSLWAYRRIVRGKDVRLCSWSCCVRHDKSHKHAALPIDYGIDRKKVDKAPTHKRPGPFYEIDAEALREALNASGVQTVQLSEVLDRSAAYVGRLVAKNQKSAPLSDVRKMGEVLGVP